MYWQTIIFSQKLSHQQNHLSIALWVNVMRMTMMVLQNYANFQNEAKFSFYTRCPNLQNLLAFRISSVDTLDGNRLARIFSMTPTFVKASSCRYFRHGRLIDCWSANHIAFQFTRAGWTDGLQTPTIAAVYSETHGEGIMATKIISFNWLILWP